MKRMFVWKPVNKRNQINIVILGAVLLLVSFMQTGKHTQPTPFVLDYPAYFGGRFTIPEDNQMTKEIVFLGRMLFYETKLSKNDKISCASCHQQKLAFTDGKQFSVGVDGSLTRRNSMSLVNLLWVSNLFWDGRSRNLEDQAIFPLTDPHEMGQPLNEAFAKLKNATYYPAMFKSAFGTDEITEGRITKAIAQFERTLISSNSRYDKYLKGEYIPTEQELRGLNLFMSRPQPEENIRGANCGHCHGTPKLFKELFHNNGLDAMAQDVGRLEITGQEIDRGRFRVPTLRNIAQTSPYMHDGRFNTLAEVLDHYNEHIQQSETLSPFIAEATNEINGKSLLLTDTEKIDILAFLNMLTDSTFLNNPEFSDPHEKQVQP
jgi:cytochrome c peroxidase